MTTKSFRAALVVITVLIAGALFFLPGLRGPFFFDDLTNLINNPYVRIHSLDYSSLYQAAFSLSAGPLQRPISMVSFAINYFFAGGFGHPAAFKLVNLIIHVVNGSLVYWVVRLILSRVESLPGLRPRFQNPKHLSLAIAFIWLIHPIQLTSVLYVVQRMTELATLFMLLGIGCYLTAREKLANGMTLRSSLLIFIAFAICWPLGLYSKETAALQPVFILVLEYALFANEPPWTLWSKASLRARLAIGGAGVLVLLTAATAVVFYALPEYSNRTFTMPERLMTEARVILFYLSLIFVPRLDALGLFHDDIAISTSLFSPWTTLPSILLVILLGIVGVALRKKNPLMSLGILWFFTGHLLESTIIALEIAHEHRNYLALLGVLLAVTGAISASNQRYARYVKVTLPLVVVILGSLTAIRSMQWSNERKMAYYEAMHHPNSAASGVRYANTLLKEHRVKESFDRMHRVAQLAPYEAGYLISLQEVKVKLGLKVDPTENHEIVRRLSRYPITAVTNNELGKIGDCVTTTCSPLQPFLEEWTQTILKNRRAKNPAFFYFLRGRSLVGQGKFNEAVESYKQANELNRNYVYPLIDLTDLYIALGKLDYASVILQALRDANKRNVVKNDHSIEHLAEKIAKQRALLRKDANARNPS